jgi:hypothetical protein
VGAVGLHQNASRSENASSRRPVEIERHGGRLSIVTAAPPRKIDRLTKRRVTPVDPVSIVHIDWSKAWRR